MTIEPIVWHGCYVESWKGLITDDSYAHPAKFARSLIQRIYRHMLAQGYVQRGQTVVDPFGGVALGALDAMRMGLRWIGCELEPKFHALGNANLRLWASKGLQGAVLLQGDSRRFASIVQQHAAAVLSSPPYAHSKPDYFTAEDRARVDRLIAEGKMQGSPSGRNARAVREATHYGTTPGQLERKVTGLLTGERIERQEKKSFFRRVHERRGAPRIDWEDVLFMEAV